MNTKQIDELVRLLEKYELSVAALYETFASIFPDSSKTWMAFVEEERVHAGWINILNKYLRHEQISFEQTKLTIQSTKTAISYIESLNDKAKEGEFDLEKALNIAIDIEKSLLESSFLKVFKIEGRDAMKIRSRLTDETKSHVDRLIEWLESI